MIPYKRCRLLIGELWFDEEPSGEKVDIRRYNQRSQPIPNAYCSEKWTIQVDLTQDAEQLFSGFKKETRYEARRALEKDAIVCEICDGRDPSLVGTFYDFFDRFYRGKGLPTIDRASNDLYVEAGMFFLSRVRSPQGEDLVWHSYLLCGNCVRLLHSASLFRESGESGFRSLVGRANRFHHWQDMLYFKQQGRRCYDFGGWYAGNTDQMKLGINKFKEEFGGQIVRQYNCVQGVSIKGKVALAIKRLVSRSYLLV
ncbi:MAG TPA: hypothetical protein VIH42_10045 [Thermoguttaceae bacterium]